MNITWATDSSNLVRSCEFSCCNSDRSVLCLHSASYNSKQNDNYSLNDPVNIELAWSSKISHSQIGSSE